MSDISGQYAIEKAKRHRKWSTRWVILSVVFFWTGIVPLIGFLRIFHHKRKVEQLEAEAQ